MRIYGAITRFTQLIFRKAGFNITLKPNTTVTYTANRTVELPEVDDNIVLSSPTASETLQNKTIIVDGAQKSVFESATGTNREVEMSISGATDNTKTTLTFSQTANRSISFPNASGSVLLDSATQTLTNKYIDGGTASNTNKITLPKAAKSVLDGLTRTQGTIVYASDENRTYVDDGSNLVPVGSGDGAGGINYIKNSDIDVSLSGYVTYADAPGMQPVDGTGGTASITIVRNTTSPLRGKGDLKISKPASNRQGDGVSYNFTIDYADSVSPKVQEISFDYRASSGFSFGNPQNPTTNPSDIVVYIYDVTNNKLIQPTPFTMDGSGKFLGKFQNNAGSTSYRLILHVATTNASAWDFWADNIKVGPQDKTHGVAASDWKSYTPTFNSGFTVGAGSTRFFWRRVGDSMEIKGMFQLESGFSMGTGDFTFSLPDGYNIDTGKIPQMGNNIGSVSYTHLTLPTIYSV